MVPMVHPIVHVLKIKPCKPKINLEEITLIVDFRKTLIRPEATFLSREMLISLH